jgi:hypothetical protein
LAADDAELTESPELAAKEPPPTATVRPVSPSQWMQTAAEMDVALWEMNATLLSNIDPAAIVSSWRSLSWAGAAIATDDIVARARAETRSLFMGCILA